MRQSARLALLGAAVAAALALPAQAAAPHFIVVSGSLLAHPIVIADWAANARLQSSVFQSPIADGRQLADRPSLDLALFWGAGWRHDELNRRPERPPTARVRGCETRVEAGRPVGRLSRPGDLVVGPIAFSGLERLARRAELERFRVGRGYRVKSGVSIRASTVVTVAVVRPARVKLEYAPPNRASDAVEFRACRGGERAFSHPGRVGPVTGFNGGFVVDRPRCVALDVWVRGRRTPLRAVVSFGAGRCAG